MKVFLVAGASMLPSLYPGDLVFTSPAKGALNEGDVVVFRNYREGLFVVHRLHKVEKGRIYTRGDALDQEDPCPVHRSQILGKVIFKIPRIGRVAHFLKRKVKKQ